MISLARRIFFRDMGLDLFSARGLDLDLDRDFDFSLLFSRYVLSFKSISILCKKLLDFLSFFESLDELL